MSRLLAWSSGRLSESNFFKVRSGLFASGFPETRSFLENRVHMSLATHNPIEIRFSQQPQRLCPRFLFFLGNSLSSAFYLVGPQPWSEETNTCLMTYNPFCFLKMALARMPIFTRRSRAGTLQIKCLHGCRKMDPWLLFASDASLLWHTSTSCKGLARKVWRQCVLVFAHDLGFRGGNCIGLLANPGLFLSTGKKYLVHFRHQRFPSDSLPRLLIQFSHVWRQSFVNEVSDLYFSSPWFSTFDSWEPISSDESPCRTILIRLGVDQTHVSSICTDRPRFHRMESLTWILKLRPVLHRIPECCHHRE